MRNLKLEELEVVNGGNSETVRANSETANSVCGNGNVASVSVDGFTCKSN